MKKHSAGFYYKAVKKQTQLLKKEGLGMKENNKYTALISFTFDIEATNREDAEYIAIQAIPKPFVFRSGRHGCGTFLRGIIPAVYTRDGLEAELLARPSVQYLIDQVSLLTAENAMLKEKAFGQSEEV
jgi:hypothetical protein